MKLKSNCKMKKQDVALTTEYDGIERVTAVEKSR
jgi:hypothetical protein